MFTSVLPHLTVYPHQLPGGRSTVKMSASVSLDEAISNFKDVFSTLDMTKSGLIVYLPFSNMSEVIPSFIINYLLFIFSFISPHMSAEPK